MTVRDAVNATAVAGDGSGGQMTVNAHCVVGSYEILYAATVRPHKLSASLPPGYSYEIHPSNHRKIFDELEDEVVLKSMRK